MPGFLGFAWQCLWKSTSSLIDERDLKGRGDKGCAAKRVLSGLRAWPEVWESVMDEDLSGDKDQHGGKAGSEQDEKHRSASFSKLICPPKHHGSHRRAQGCCCLAGSGRRRASMPSSDTTGLSVPERHEQP